jgi:hypothetical protein
MAVQKANPLPNGLYWIDLFSPSSSSPTTKDGPAIFFGWVNANAGRVIVRRTEEFPEPDLGGPKRTWVLFEVKGPPGAFPFGLGYPNITTNPDEPSFYSELPSSPDFADWLQGGADTLVVLALLYILSQWKKG